MIIFGEIATGLFNYTLKPGGMSEERERELKTKKKWVTPQLIVLVRGKSEGEFLLGSCKYYEPKGPGSLHGRCWYNPDYPAGPQQCFTMSPS